MELRKTTPRLKVSKGALIDERSLPSLVLSQCLLASPTSLSVLQVVHRKDDQKIYIPQIGWI